MRFTDRLEYKYVLDLKTYFALKHKLMIFMKPGYHTKISSTGRYFVRSLYYDTYDFKHYKEAEDGQFGRIKCRVRTYEPFIANAEIISIEIKTKHGQNVKKYSELIPLNEYLEFLRDGSFNKSSVVLDEFTRLINNYNLEPKLIIEYEREGFVTKDKSDLRITFDHNVRSAVSEVLFDDKLIGVRRHSPTVVCEIKCGMKKPVWLEALVKEYGLKVVGNSKYVQAVQRMNPNIIRNEVYSNAPLFTKKVDVLDE